jgi:hypothetical protein
VLQKIIARVTKLLENRGLIEFDQEDNLQVCMEEDDALARLQAGAAKPQYGQKALTLKTVPETDHNSTQGLVAKSSGFSLHAAAPSPVQSTTRSRSSAAISQDPLSPLTGSP